MATADDSKQPKGQIMIEKRKFHRVQLSSDTILKHHDTTHKGQLENISMNGALIRFEYDTYLPLGYRYDLTIYVDGDDIPLQLIVEVVCVNFAMAGIKFVSYISDTETRLAKLIDILSSKPDIARIEHEMIRRRLAEYLSEE